MKQEKKTETRQHVKHSYVSQFGRAYCYVTCPFCGADIKAYVWSLAGSGKKCTCGALHGSFGITVKEIK